MINIKLTKGEANYLLSLINDNKKEGCYWGPKQQHWKRADKIYDMIVSQWEIKNKQKKG